MPWLALPLDVAAGQLGQQLGDKYGVKGIPSLVLVDELGQTITTDARNKIPADRAVIGRHCIFDLECACKRGREG